MAWEDSGCQKIRVNHKPRGICPGLEQERPFLQARKVRKRGSSWVASEGAEPAPGGGDAGEGLSLGQSGGSDRTSSKSRVMGKPRLHWTLLGCAGYPAAYTEFL